MSEQPGAPAPAAGAAPPPAGAPPAGGGSWFTAQSIRGVPNWALISVVALLTVGGVLWWRSRQSAKTAAAQQTTGAANPAAAVAGTTSSTAGQCYDASGNPVPCTQADYASQIAALQAEIDNLHGSPSVPASYAPSTSVPTATAQTVQPGVGTTSPAGTSAAVASGTGAG